MPVIFGETRPVRVNYLDLLAAVLVFAVFVGVGLATIEGYGLTWDEPENLVVGERYLAFLSSGDASVLDFSRSQPELDNPDGLHFRRLDSHIHPPLPNVLAALGGRIFGRWTGWFDPVDARHIATIVMGGLTVSATYLFAREAFGRLVAVFSVLALITYPRFVAHSHFNLKDIPKTLMFVLALWWIWRGLVFARAAWIASGGLALGVGLSVRPNLVLAAVAAGVWLMLALPLWRRKRSLWWGLMTAPLCVVFGFVAVWPTMWIGFVDTVRELYYYWTMAALSDRLQWTPYPVLILGIVTPVPTLVLVCWGVVAIFRLWRYDPERTLALLALWVGLPLFRVSMPRMNTYDGIRHLLEVVPALAILAGLGGQEIVWLASRLKRGFSGLAVGSVVCIFILATIQTCDIAPYGIAYFNDVIGGTLGAQNSGIQDATDYWGTSYRHGCRWLSENADVEGVVVVPEGQSHILAAVEDIWLREDLALATHSELASGSVYVMFTTRSTEYGPVEWYCRQKLRPVFAIETQGASILEIYRFEKAEWNRLQDGEWAD